MSSIICIERVPLGPFTESTAPSTEAVTPLGRATGTFPMRLISEHLREDFAADILFPRLGVGKNAAGSRDDGDAEAVADPRQILAARINAAAGVGGAGEGAESGGGGEAGR